MDNKNVHSRIHHNGSHLQLLDNQLFECKNRFRSRLGSRLYSARSNDGFSYLLKSSKALLGRFARHVSRDGYSLNSTKEHKQASPCHRFVAGIVAGCRASAPSSAYKSVHLVSLYVAYSLLLRSPVRDSGWITDIGRCVDMLLGSRYQFLRLLERIGV